MNLRSPAFEQLAYGLLAWLLAGATVACAQFVDTRVVGGENFVARLTRATEEGALTFALEGSGGERRLTLANLVAWGSPAEPRRGPLVVAVDGSLVVGEVIQIVDEQLLLLTGTFDETHLPLESIRGVILDLPTEPRERDLLIGSIQSAKGDADRLRLANGDELSGTITGLTQEKVTLKTPARVVEVETSKIAALVFNPSLVDKKPLQGPRALVGFRDGTLLVASSLVVNPEEVQVTLPSGAALTCNASKDLVYLQPLGHGLTYLSDLTPVDYRHVPYLTLTWPYRADHSVTGGRLRARERVYTKGLGMHTASRIVYRLEKPYRRFEAELAIDDSAGGRGSAIYRVYVNDGKAWKQAYASETVRGGAAPLPISVDLAGVKAITLAVEFAERGDELDHADWLSARLVE